MSVSVLDHATELEKLLIEHNVNVFGYERRDDYAIVRFILQGRKLRLVVRMPDWNDPFYRVTPNTGRERAMDARRKIFWGDVRKVWLAMKNLIAAKLEGVEAGITTFEDEFRQFEDAAALIGSGELDRDAVSA